MHADDPGQISFSVHYKGEFFRYAIAARAGLLNDLFLLRYSEGDFPKTAVSVEKCYPMGFALTEGEWVPFRVEVRSGHTMVWAGAKKMPQFDYRDPLPIEGGGIALGGGWQWNEFKNINVEPFDGAVSAVSDGVRRLAFGPADAPAPENFQRVSGGAAGAMGWDRDLNSKLRLRKETEDALLQGNLCLGTDDKEAKFHIPVPNGEYYVTLGGGDAASFSQWRVSVQGVSFADAKLVPMEFIDESRQVTVTNGVLEITLHGISDRPHGIVNPLNYAIIRPWASLYGEIPDARKVRQEQRAAYLPEKITPSGAGRETSSLDGKWLFLPEQDVPPGTKPQDPATDDTAWHIVSIPSFWNPNGWWIYTGERRVGESYTAREIARVNAQTFNWKGTKIAWYRQWLDLPAKAEHGRRYLIHFQAVASAAKVYFNGQEVGSHTGMFAPFEVDVTNHIRWGEKNLLAVRVVGEAPMALGDANKVLDEMVSMVVTSEHVATLPRGIIYSTIRDLQGRPTNERPSGIWQPVSLITTANAKIGGFFFKPRLDGADLDVDVANDSDKPFVGRVVVSVAKVQLENSISIPSNGTVTIHPSIAPGEVKLWSPESPNLYPLKITLMSNDGKIADRVEKEVGFRTAEVRADKFYLNGKPYWLGGANSLPHGLAPNDTVLADKLMKILHQNHIRIDRSHATPMTRQWVDAANRDGVGISLEGTWPWVLSANTEIPDKKLWDAWMAEMRDLVRDLRNDPSILVWTLSNENHIDFDKDEARRLKKWEMWQGVMKMVRSEDPTRPITVYSGYERVDNRHPVVDGDKSPLAYYEKFIKKNNIWDGDFSDEHRYLGLYSPSIFSYQYHERSRNSDCGIAVWSQESATGYPNNDTGHMERKYIRDYVPQAWVGKDAYDHRNPSAYLNHVAFMTKEWMEKVRRDRNTAGWQMFNLGNWFRHPYDADALQPYPALEAARLALQSVLVSLDLRDRHAISGQKIKPIVYVVNDSDNAETVRNLKANLELDDPAGKPLSHSEISVEDTPYFEERKASAELAIPAELPAELADYTLQVTLKGDGKQISQNRYLLKIAGKQWTDAPAKSAEGLTVGAVNLPPALANIIKTFGVNLDTQTPWNNRTVLFGGKATPAADSDEGRGLLNYAEQGGRLVLLEVGDVVPLFPTIVQPAKSGESLFPEVAEPWVGSEKLFVGFRPHDLTWWNGNGDRPEVARTAPTVDDKAEGVRVLAHYIAPSINNSAPEKGRRTVFFEVTRGRGKILVCPLRVSAADTDPLARRFLANLLATFQKL
jgi:hypothetical protein